MCKLTGTTINKPESRNQGVRTGKKHRGFLRSTAKSTAPQRPNTSVGILHPNRGDVLHSMEGIITELWDGWIERDLKDHRTMGLLGWKGP